MKSEMAVLKRRALHRSEAVDRLAVFKDAFVGETCYILTCGPSLKQVWCKELHEFLRDKLVITVKQSAQMAGDISCFHLFNNCHPERNKINKNTVSCSMGNPKHRNADMVFHLQHPIRESSLALHPHYDKWTFDKSLKRPFCGIMHEIGIYIPIHLGCKRIVVFGWDLNVKDPTHFYGGHYNEQKEVKNIMTELELHCKHSAKLTAWMNSIGIELLLCSPLSGMSIPQVELTDVMNEDYEKEGIEMPAYDAKIEVKKAYTRANWKMAKYTVKVTNTGEKQWVSPEGKAKRGTLRLRSKATPMDGTGKVDSLKPGESVTFKLKVAKTELPATIQMVREHYAWFGDKAELV